MSDQILPQLLIELAPVVAATATTLGFIVASVVGTLGYLQYRNQREARDEQKLFALQQSYINLFEKYLSEREALRAKVMSADFSDGNLKEIESLAPDIAQMLRYLSILIPYNRASYSLSIKSDMILLSADAEFVSGLVKNLHAKLILFHTSTLLNNGIAAAAALGAGGDALRWKAVREAVVKIESDKQKSAISAADDIVNLVKPITNEIDRKIDEAQSKLGFEQTIPFEESIVDRFEQMSVMISESQAVQRLASEKRS